MVSLFLYFKGVKSKDLFMVGQLIRFLFTCCETLETNERVPKHTVLKQHSRFWLDVSLFSDVDKEMHGFWLDVSFFYTREYWLSKEQWILNSNLLNENFNLLIFKLSQTLFAPLQTEPPVVYIIIFKDSIIYLSIYC